MVPPRAWHTFDLRFEPEPTPGDVRFIDDRLYDFNVATTGIDDGRFLAMYVRDEHGAIRAGLYGHTWGGCCEIKQLWVGDALRGQGLGRALMEKAEAEARRRGCGQILLTTHSFQAPGFYRKLGFQLLATMDDYPRGHQQLLFRKSLVTG